MNESNTIFMIYFGIFLAIFFVGLGVVSVIAIDNEFEKSYRENYIKPIAHRILNPIEFESYGAHLRNLLTPYANLIALVEGLKKGIFTREQFDKLTENMDNGLNALIEFSKTTKLEQLNWRE